MGFFIVWEVTKTETNLQHHGILGMKWGVRRYQNADGTLTKEGKQRKKQQEHNDTLSYRVGSKRLNKRISNMEEQMTSDLASTNRKKQYSVGQRGIVRRETQAALNNPSRTSDVGRATIKGRTLATIGALSASGAAACAGSLVGATAIPVVGIPASMISAGIYWYKSMS